MRTLRTTRLVIGASGVLAIGFGAYQALAHLGTRLPHLVLWLAAPVAVHDGLIVPATLGLAWLVRRVLPRPAWGPVVVGAAVSGGLVLIALPALLSPATGSIPGLLDRNYGVGLLLALACCWLLVAVLIAARLLLGRSETLPMEPVDQG